jgi:hypothetical protein
MIMDARTIKMRGRLFILFIILKRIPAPFQGTGIGGNLFG